MVIYEIITQQQYHPGETNYTNDRSTYDIGFVHTQPHDQYYIDRKTSREHISRHPLHYLWYPFPGVYPECPMAIYQ